MQSSVYSSDLDYLWVRLINFLIGIMRFPHLLLQKQLKEGSVCFGSQFAGPDHHSKESTAVGAEAAGYTASTVRKQSEGNTGVQLSFSFLVSPGPQLMEWAVCI